MKRSSIFLWICCFFSTILLAQNPTTRDCGTMEYLEKLTQKNPQLVSKMAKIEEQIQQNILIQNKSIDGDIITIPVVVHVIYNTQQQNISDAQILSQIEVLNEDFRRANSDRDNVWSQAADTQIEFCLAQVDPNGNTTNGITRKATNTRGFSGDDMKFSSRGGTDAWDTSKYMNMWVAPFSNSGLLGFAQFPGGPAATDGVAMAPQFFGSSAKGNGFFLSAPFDLGRTTTHEVGHFLNLRHIWGDGNCNRDDFVNDTPNANGSNGGCQIGSSSCGSVDMVQNYMDYSDDGCMNLFTLGQRNRMRAVLLNNGPRASLANSNRCSTVVDPDPDPDPDPNPGCADVELSFTFDRYPEDISFEIRNESGSVIASGGPYGSEADNSTITLRGCVDNGCYDLIIRDSYGDGLCCRYGNGSYELTTKAGEVLASGARFGSGETTAFCLGRSSRTDGSDVGVTRTGEGPENIQIFPSPVSGNTLNIIGASFGDAYEVINIQGQVIISDKLNGRTIDVTKLAQGMYIFKVGTDRASYISFVRK